MKKPIRDTGFHPLDPDWTRGRSVAVSEANSIARRQIAMARHKISMKSKENPNE